MRPPGYMRLIEKAEAALVAAIEIYNKPNFPYREESFAILAVNAWELLIKAKVMSENGGAKASIYEYTQRLTAKNELSKKRQLKLGVRHGRRFRDEAQWHWH